MNFEAPVKILPKNIAQSQVGAVNYFVSNNVQTLEGKMNFHSSAVYVAEQSFKTLFGLKSRFKDLRVDMIFEKAQILGIDSPTQEVYMLANSILDRLHQMGLSADFVNPSKEGGVILELSKNENYYLFELFNDGDIVFLKRNGQNREAFDLDESNVFEVFETI